MTALAVTVAPCPVAAGPFNLKFRSSLSSNRSYFKLYRLGTPSRTVTRRVRRGQPSRSDAESGCRREVRVGLHVARFGPLTRSPSRSSRRIQLEYTSSVVQSANHGRASLNFCISSSRQMPVLAIQVNPRTAGIPTTCKLQLEVELELGSST